MVPRILLPIFLCLAFFVAHAQPRAQYTPDEYLKNFALSTCLAKGFPKSDLALDAKAAAGGYVELGAYDAEAYMESLQIVDQFLARTYKSKNSDTPLTVMKCIDLYHSAELQSLATRYRAADLGQHQSSANKK